MKITWFYLIISSFCCASVPAFGLVSLDISDSFSSFSANTSSGNDVNESLARNVSTFYFGPQALQAGVAFAYLRPYSGITTYMMGVGARVEALDYFLGVAAGAARYQSSLQTDNTWQNGEAAFVEIGRYFPIFPCLSAKISVTGFYEHIPYAEDEIKVLEVAPFVGFQFHI